MTGAQGPPVPTRTIRAREYGEVAMTWHYLVDVDASLTDKEAHDEAIRAVKAGDADPYDSSTGETTGSDRTYGTDFLEAWESPPSTWGAS